jgi:hypothetical protein
MVVEYEDPTLPVRQETIYLWAHRVRRAWPMLTHAFARAAPRSSLSSVRSSKG